MVWLLTSLLALPVAGNLAENHACSALNSALQDENARLRAVVDELNGMLHVARGLAETPLEGVEGEAEEKPGLAKEESLEREGEGLEEEEEVFTRVDIGCSFMLLGSLFFGMILFYLVNWPDDEIKSYSWSIINTTTSIFTAVLIFSGIDEVLVQCVITPALGAFPTGEKQIIRVACGFAIFVFWYVIMQAAVAYNCNVETILLPCFRRRNQPLKQEKWVIADGLRGDDGTIVEAHKIEHLGLSKSIATIDNVEVFVASKDINEEVRERRAKCWGTLFAHMAGFAMISAGGDVQHSVPFRDSPLMSYVSVVINAAFMFIVFRIGSCCQPTNSSEREDIEEAIEFYKEEMSEAQDDIFSLAVSFLLIQAVKFTLTGTLPDKLGATPHAHEITGTTCASLFATSVLLCIMIAVSAITLKGKVGALVGGTCSMSFAWSFLFASKWFFMSFPFLTKRHVSPETIEGRVLLSLSLSAFAFSAIIILDKIEDSQDDDRKMHKVVKNVVTGLSILVGFTWEHSFDGGVEAISSLWEDPLLLKLAGTILIAVVVIPAWRRHILMKHIHLLKYRRERKAAVRKDKAASASSDEEGSSHSSDCLLCT